VLISVIVGVMLMVDEGSAAAVVIESEILLSVSRISVSVDVLV